MLQVLLLVALEVLEVAAEMLRRYRCFQTYAEALFRVLLRSGVAARRRNATALEGNAIGCSPCRKTENSSLAGERDVLWTDGGFSGAFWGSGLGVVVFQLKIGATAPAE